MAMGQGQGDPGGSAGGQSGGYGEGGQLQYRYRLVGLKWVWDDKTNADPRLWAGHSEEYDISTTGYIYGSVSDALAAGKVAGEADGNCVRVFSEPSMTGFTSEQYTWTDRYQTISNSGAKEADEAYQKIASDKGDTPPLELGDWPLKLLIIGGIIAVMVYFLFIKGRPLPAMPALPAAPAVAAVPVPIPEAKI